MSQSDSQPDDVRSSVTASQPDVNEAERLVQLLVEEFRGLLDEEVVRSIAYDFDVTQCYDEIRGQLQSLAESASIEYVLLNDVEQVHLGSNGPGTAPATSVSRPTTAQSSRSGLTSPSENSDLGKLGTTLVFPEIEDEQKLLYLQQMFPGAKEYTIRYILKQVRGDVEKATEELLTREELEGNGELPKGVNGFFRPEDDTTVTSKTKAPSRSQDASPRGSPLFVDYFVHSSQDVHEEIEGPDGRLNPPRLKPLPRDSSARQASSSASSVKVRPVQRSDPLPAPQSPPAEPISKKSANSWLTVESRRRLTKTTVHTTGPDAHAMAAVMKQAAASRYQAAAAAARRAGSDKLFGQVAAVHAEQAREAARAANEAASASYDQLINERSTGSSIDLHHLPVHEGVRIAKERVRQWWDGLDGENRARRARESGGFEVITGQGKHNANGVSRLRQEVFAALRADGWSVTTLTGGCVVTGRA